jgi:RHS repeat-associated protein
VDVWLERAAEPSGLLDSNNEPPSQVGVANIDYDAKGQRLRLDYKNGASTSYGYDPLTFRLTQLLTRRDVSGFPDDDPQPPTAGWPGSQVRNLHYTYDPAGNITHIQDDAQQTIYFRNKRVEPSNDFNYDALYRLLQATGREHLGQGGAPIAYSHDDAGRVGLVSADAAGRFAPNDGNAMGTYTERYVYDAVGNFLQMQHRGSDPTHAGWTRAYDYLEPSLIEDGNGGNPLKTSNRVSRTTINPTGTNPPQVDPYQHDAHGNMVRMPHLGAGLPEPSMQWDYKNQLRQTNLGGGGTAYYVYDASGQRVRKVWQKAPGLTEERIYLAGFELFRKHRGSIGANTATLERETLHVMDDRQRIALVETRTFDTAGTDQAPRQLIRNQFGNHLGSACLELDERAQVISYEEYAPYGSSTYQAGRSQTETARRYRYTGKERDEESGFYYHGARYYAAWLGRWTSCDPAGPADGPNLFEAFRDNPANFRDPSGQESVGQLIEQKALRSADEERYVSLYFWSFLDVTWSVFGAEGVSRVAADPQKASMGDYVQAAIEVAAVVPVGKIAKGGKALIAAKEVAPTVVKEAAPVVVKEAAPVVAKEAAPVVAKEAAPVVAKEAAPVVEKETAEKATKQAAKKQAAKKQATKGAKRGPKTDPGAPHNKTIREEAEKLEKEGNTIVAGGGRAKERLVPTPGGKKAGRRPDILYETPTGEVRGRNVGKVNAQGLPVPREVDALSDLNGPGGLPTDFVPYNIGK